MRREMKRRFRRYAITTVIAAAPAAVLCAYVTNLLVPTDPLPKPASFDYVPVAVINDSNDTIGIADSDIYGLSLPNGQLDTAMVDKHLQAMKDLGVDSVRVLIPWADIQPVPPGEFPTPEWEEAMWTRSQYIIDKADELGLSVLGVLNTTPSWGDDPDEPGYGIYTPPDPDLYAAWAATVAERFAGKVSAYEIWNEPNYDQYWTAGPDPEHYTEILKAAYAAIKGIDDEAMVVAGVLGTVQNSGVTMNPVDFIQRMYAADAEGFFDALSIHPYSNQISFSEGLDPDNQWQTPIEQLIAIRQLMMANDDEELKIWATEYGLSTTIKDEQTQAEWVKDFLDTWDDYDFTGPAFLYTLRDRLDTTTEEGSMGIFEYDWTEKLVAKVIRCATKGIDCGPLGPEEPEEPGPNPVGELAEAIQAIVQQLYTVVTQALTAVTEFANAIVNTIVEALNNLFSAVNPAPQIADVPAETRMSIAGALTTAAAEVTGEEAPVDAVDAVDTPVDESATPEAPAGEVAEPEVTEPDVADPAVTAPEVTEPAVTEPEVTEPEVTEPAVTEPEVTEPEVTEPEEPTVVETEAPEVPETEEPQAVEPEQPDAVEPDESDSTEEDKDTSTGRGESDESSDEDATDDDRSDSSDAGSRGGEGSTGSANGSGGGSSSSGGASGGTTGGAGGSGSGGASGGSGSGGSDGGDSGGSDGGSDGGGSGGGSGNVGYVDPAQGEVIIAA